MKCPKCHSTNIEYDASRADTICANCGQVLETSGVTNEVTFENTKVVGTFINEQTGGLSMAKNRFGLSLTDPSVIRLNKARRLITKVAEGLNLKQTSIIDRAVNYYKMASIKKFIQGRKTVHVVGVILYTICRLEKTRHLLIDFSDVLQTNLYVLGSLFLKFIRIFQIIVPIIDPSLYLDRFCNKLDFKDRTKIVGKTALKILQCMKRNWMDTGRRPAGLCGASILIAARYHGFKRSIQQIIKVVNVCDETIRRRLEEFSNTSVAKMTKSEFESISLNECSSGLNPPAFTRNRIKEKKERYKQSLARVNNFTKTTNITTEDVENDESLAFSKKARDIENIFEENITNHTRDQNESKPIAATFASPNKSAFTRIELKGTSKQDHDSADNETLSDIDDKEVHNYLLTKEEYKLKKMLWDVLFRDWIEEQQLKSGVEKKEKRKRINKLHKSKDYSESKNPLESIQKSTKFGSRLNYSLVGNMFKK